MDRYIHLLSVAVLLLVTLLLNAADTVTNGQTVARSRFVQQLDSAADVSVSLGLVTTNLTFGWEIWNTGTNTITITNGISGTNVALSASAVVGLRALDTNTWRIIYKQP